MVIKCVDFKMLIDAHRVQPFVAGGLLPSTGPIAEGEEKKDEKTNNYCFSGCIRIADSIVYYKLTNGCQKNIDEIENCIYLKPCLNQENNLNIKLQAVVFLGCLVLWKCINSLAAALTLFYGPNHMCVTSAIIINVLFFS